MMFAKHQWPSLELLIGNPSVTTVWSECIIDAGSVVIKGLSEGSLPKVHLKFY